MNKKLPDLQGKTALITGASAGLGVHFAQLLAAQHCNLILVARRQERLEALQAKLTQSFGIKVTIIPFDLAQSQGAEDLYSQINSLGLTIDILINNAGVGVGDVFYKNDLAKLTNMLNLNMVNLAVLTRLVASDMVSRHSGHILFVSSIAGDIISPRMLAYSATKSFVTSFGLGLKVELANTGVACTVLAPGPMNTEFFVAAGTKDFGVVQKVLGTKPEEVVLAGLVGLFHGRAYVVPGGLNKIAVLLTRSMPRVWGIRVLKKVLAFKGVRG